MDIVVTPGSERHRSVDQGLLKAFSIRSQLSDRPLVAVSPDYVMGNWAAQPFLATLDFQQALATRTVGDPWSAVDVFEATDPGVLIEMAAHDGDAGAAREVSDPFVRSLPGTSKLIAKVRQAAERWLDRTGHVLISGEAGTGKATLAEHLLMRLPGTFAIVDIARHADWFERMVMALRERRHVALLHTSTLRDADAPDLLQQLDGAARRQLRVVMTATPCLPLQLQALSRRVETRLWIPPLRDRIEDIPAIVAASPSRRRTHRLDGDTLRWLWSRQWPGNLRELAAAMRTGPRRRAVPNLSSSDAGIGASDTSRRVPLAQDLQKRALQQTLDRCEGNRSRAALMMGVSRATLYRKLDQFRLRS